MTNHDPVILSARFDNDVIRYIVANTAIVCLVTVVGIPLLPIALPVAIVLGKVYFSRLRCDLTERSLQINKGILTRTESTVPLDKITDVQLLQGPIMRWAGIHALKIETAGQLGSPMILGVVDAPEFRNRVLAERDRATSQRTGAGPAQPDDTVALLREIRDTLLRLERAGGDPR